MSAPPTTDKDLLKGTHIRVKMRVTKWFIWKCPEKRCRTRIEATVENFVIYRAVEHRKRHIAQKAKAKAIAERRAILGITG
jgi:hypothetical protein